MARYGLTVIGAAMVLGILKTIGGKTKVLEWAGGLFLALVMLQPLGDFDFTDITAYMEGFSLEGQRTAAMGRLQGDEAYRAVIKSELEAYILDKAVGLGADLQVEVVLQDEGLPESVRLLGDVSPAAKARLSQIIEEDLAIAKENQLWIG